MKRIALVSLAFAAISFANAQSTTRTETGKARFGIKAGVNFQNLTGKDYNGDKMSNKIKVGGIAGVNVQLPIATDFYIQPGLEFNMKGAKSNDGNVSSHLNYLDVPISLLYKPALSGGHLLLGFGPYIGFGLGGKIQYNGEKTDVKFKKSVTSSEYNSPSGTAYFKPIDAGANIFAGYEFSRLSFQVFSQLGLTDITPEVQGYSTGKQSIKNTGFGLTLGYSL